MLNDKQNALKISLSPNTARLHSAYPASRESALERTAADNNNILPDILRNLQNV